MVAKTAPRTPLPSSTVKNTLAPVHDQIERDPLPELKPSTSGEESAGVDVTTTPLSRDTGVVVLSIRVREGDGVASGVAAAEGSRVSSGAS